MAAQGTSQGPHAVGQLACDALACWRLGHGSGSHASGLLWSRFGRGSRGGLASAAIGRDGALPLLGAWSGGGGAAGIGELLQAAAFPGRGCACKEKLTQACLLGWSKE